MAAFSRQISEHMITTDRFVDAESNPLIKLQAVVQLAAFASGSVIQIHPFLNGNGRIARLLANFILNRYGYRMPFYIARPGTADYALASAEAMRTGNFTLLYQYLLEILALQ
jgi:Fic family protein